MKTLGLTLKFSVLSLCEVGQSKKTHMKIGLEVCDGT